VVYAILRIDKPRAKPQNTPMPEYSPDSIIDLEPAMIQVATGKIILKDEATKRLWKVDLPTYWLGKYPVTQELYFAVTQQSPSAFRGSQLPVDSVSWLEAIRFCNLLSQKLGLEPCYELDNQDVHFSATANGYRLPLEAEWEYACRAGNFETRYGELEEIAWYAGNSDETIHVVGTKAANAWGFHDMIGNVWEWCWDVYDPEVYGQYRVFRGGGWFDQPRACRASCRRRSHPTHKIDDLGFRIARSVKN
jgi:formylglycine-generating enzyme required for sulfatase activity